jgi:hypothetical protein
LSKFLQACKLYNQSVNKGYVGDLQYGTLQALYLLGLPVKVNPIRLAVTYWHFHIHFHFPVKMEQETDIKDHPDIPPIHFCA